MKKAIKLFLIVFALFISFTKENSAQSSINGRLNIDSTWNKVIYLSLISNFEQLNSMSSQMILESSELNKSGNFTFETDYLPTKNNLYRIHLSKKGDPRASLIIGGKDENHLFFISNNQSNIFIQNSNKNSLFGNTEIEGFLPAKMIMEINEMVLFVDTANFNTSVLKRELVEKALDEKLRQFADTCSFPLVALYAIYKTDFERNIIVNPNFYKHFLEKWSDEESPYFEEFRKNIPSEIVKRNYSFLYVILGLILGAFITFFILKRKPQKNYPLHDLTIQERKIFALLQNEKSNKEIYDELNISLSTVKSHVNNIFSKLNIKSRREVLNFEKD